MFITDTLYKLLKIFVCLWHSAFYHKIIVKGKNNIPKNSAIIFAPNHQNAIMDALAVLCTSGKDVTFLARSDFFSNKFFKILLSFFKILPAYRINEGFSSVQNNKHTFNIACKLLSQKKTICIMPEGGHEGVKMLRNLKNGLFKIAFQAQEMMIDSSVFIVPVGIYYSSYTDFKSTLIINYGQPINVRSYINYDNRNKSLIKLKEDLEMLLKDNIVHYNSKELYNYFNYQMPFFIDYFVQMRSIATDYEAYLIERKIVEKLNTENALNIRKINLLKENINNSHIINLARYVKANKKVDVSLLFVIIASTIIFMPIILACSIIYGVMFLASFTINSRIHDRQFHSSVKYVFSFVFLTTISIIIISYLVLILSNILSALFIGTCIIISILLFSEYIYFFKLVRDKIKVNINSKYIEEIREMVSEQLKVVGYDKII